VSKRKQSIWDDGLRQFPMEKDNNWPVELYEEDIEALDDAQEALSRLYNKTNKRSKQIKGVRRNDAWH